MNRRHFLAAPGALAAASAAQASAATRLIQAALDDQLGWKRLEYLCDSIGHRLSGSAGMARSIDWAVAEMKKDGLEGVAAPDVMVPHWVRGHESAHLVSPWQTALPMLGLGGSIGTPSGGITAETVAVESFDELDSLGAEKVRGKIVVYAVPWEGYGKTVAYRGNGAIRGAQLGAAAVLVRGAGPVGQRTPHTGAMRYQDGVARIPAAGISAEDAMMLLRLSRAGTPATVRLEMGAQTWPDAKGANVIAEWRGHEKPEEIVVLGGHFDSWDAGQGAHDDGAACIAAWTAVKLMKDLNLRARRTVRVVLWANEENGLRGGRAYREWVGDQVKNHVAAIEMDGGCEKPSGFGLTIPNAAPPVQDRGLALLKQIAAPLASIQASEIVAGGGGADIGPIMREGVPGLALRTTGGRYFEWHHTHADTIDKIDPRHFREAVAALAVVANGLADSESRLAG
ncbi:MAG: M20/M25/M40 family metallo-hydrolase [Bryobacteraceae bacterium]|nr:M20/M25/M40 family metallo-hydrolase [Bryobacteraceae bacterium]